MDYFGLLSITVQFALCHTGSLLMITPLLLSPPLPTSPHFPTPLFSPSLLPPPLLPLILCSPFLPSLPIYPFSSFLFSWQLMHSCVLSCYWHLLWIYTFRCGGFKKSPKEERNRYILLWYYMHYILITLCYSDPPISRTRGNLTFLPYIMILA